MADQGRKPEFDLEERTASFGEAVIRFVMPIRWTPVTKPLISQLVRAATSIGANYCEADESGTRKEFRYRISLSRREARETRYWLRMLVSAIPELADDARVLWKEADELTRIFAAIHKNSRNKPSQ
ncbi:MAG: four helix bundle protein [Fuerstiella sp.]